MVKSPAKVFVSIMQIFHFQTQVLSVMFIIDDKMKKCKKRFQEIPSFDFELTYL